MTTDNRTPEEQLAAVIEAQVKGGFDWHDQWLGYDKGIHDGMLVYDSETYVHILEILLDTDAAKAAYPGWWCEDCAGQCPPKVIHPFRLEYWKEATRSIHWAWHSENGNNWKAAIQTAYNLLPHA